MEQPIDTIANSRNAAGVSRRALLAGASKAAVPAIVTLYSGAALARSSNLISADPTPSADGNLYRCLDTSSVYSVGNNTYDLGTPPMGHVTQISSQAKYVKIGSNGQPTNIAVTGDQMCATGGSYYRKGYSGFTKVTVRKGAIVSATALGSFANNVTYTNI
jgi:hypothetical protein